MAPVMTLSFTGPAHQLVSKIKILLNPGQLAPAPCRLLVLLEDCARLRLPFSATHHPCSAQRFMIAARSALSQLDESWAAWLASAREERHQCDVHHTPL